MTNIKSGDVYADTNCSILLLENAWTVRWIVVYLNDGGEQPEYTGGRTSEEMTNFLKSNTHYEYLGNIADELNELGLGLTKLVSR